MPDPRHRSRPHRPSVSFTTLATGIVLSACLGTASGTAAAPESGVRWGYLSNGSGYLIIANRSAPMVGCSAVVHGGSGAESAESQGASHMLEHLLFNGTESLSQEELYAGFDRLGTYSNATTRPTHVNYMILGPSERFWDAFALQTDMIFRSVLPQEKLEKERGIVLEELAKDRLDPDYQVDRTLEVDLFGPRGYGLPTLGTTTSIQALTRERIVDFYRSFYGPEHLTWILIGDLDPDATVDSLEARVGVFPARALGLDPTVSGPDPSGPDLRDHVLAAVAAPRVRFVWMGTPPDTKEYLGFEAAFEMACDGDASPLGTRAQALGATSYSASLRLFPGFTLAQVDCELSPGTDPDAFVSGFRQAAGEVALRPVDPAGLERWKVGRETEEVFLREKPHYYAVFRGDRIVARGLPGIAGELSGIQSLTSAALKGVLPIGAAPVRISILRPARIAGAVADQGIAEAPHDRVHGGQPETEAAQDQGEAPPSELARWTLPNGLSVVSRSGPESSVFAAHLFIRGRSVREPVPGAAELLHSLLGTATGSRNESRLRDDLAAIGAELKAADAAYIPYDDFYSVPEFSYVRLQTLDRFASQALEILADVVGHPSWDEKAFEAAKQGAIERAAKEDRTPRTRVRQAIKEVYGIESSNAYVFGTESALRSLDYAAFQKFAKEYLDPRGMFLVLASGLPTTVLEERTESSLGRLPALASPLAPRWTLPPWSEGYLATVQESGGSMETAGNVGESSWSEIFGELPAPPIVHLESVGASQSYIAFTQVLTVPEGSEPAVELAGALLSDRIAFQLREREGLAYSIGASVTPLGSGRWLYQAAAGTRGENLPRMLIGLREGVSTALAEPIDADALETLVASLEGRSLMRRITRMNWAFYAGAAWLRGEDPAGDLGLYDRMRAVSATEVDGALRTLWPGADEGVFVVR